MGINFFTFNSTSSDSYDIRIEKSPDYPVAQRVVEQIHVDGRNGDLIRDTGAYKNVDMKYSIYFNGKSSSFQEVARQVAFWLNGSTGYNRLEDSYDPDVYRWATMSSYTEYRNWQNTFGRADVTFSCKPQRFFKNGDSEFTPDGFIPNDWMPCKPILIVEGVGDITIGNSNINVWGNAGRVMYIDCETENAYSGIVGDEVQKMQKINIRRNSTYTLPISFDASGFPTLYLSADARCRFGGSQVHWDLEIPTEEDFTYVDRLGTSADQITVSKLANDNKITFTTGSSFFNNAVDISNLVLRVMQNRNNNIYVTGGFPTIPTGGIEVTTDVDDLKVIPRWWTL